MVMVTVMGETLRPKDPRREPGVVVGDREALQADLRELRRLRARERQTASMVHDFNNLLTAITCSSALLRRDVEPGGRAASMVHEIRDAADRAVALVRRMLAASRNEQLAPEPVNIGEVVVGLEPLLARIAGPDVDVQVSIDPLAGFAAVDRDELEHVLLNLAVNARQAMPEGGALGIIAMPVSFAEHEARVLSAGPGAHVALQVIDTGVGMPPEVRERAFEPNFTTREEGSGLGLASAHRFAAESGGSIAIWSEPGAGTAVTIYLPRSDALEEAPPSTLRSELLPRGNETVLIVEADDAVRRVVCTLLAELGYLVLDAVSGEDAFELARDYRSPIHLVLADVALPDCDGRELGERLVASGRCARALAMTGRAEHLSPSPGEASPPLLRKAFSALEHAQKEREVLAA
jgi:CheY-like chemotaxis protein